ncbi:hypothetical protein COV17_00385 [Candidatus Woesearchaeota archaeon CG10_big_fil_rev_8_21_14_0_10_36_11]|nr:MAG: hypothetical protein COV17_00385 [Candidatus Woesearchaeota archaeon CG10_big_fil_rev_8_21_14_0_10_36_11]
MKKGNKTVLFFVLITIIIFTGCQKIQQQSITNNDIPAQEEVNEQITESQPVEENSASIVTQTEREQEETENNIEEKLNLWQYLGEAGFTPDRAATLPKSYNGGYSDARSLDFILYKGTPYIAFKDGSQLSDQNDPESGKISVMKYAGTWEYVGQPGFSTGRTPWISLFIYDDKGQPEIYVAYADRSLDDQAFVKKYSGNSWINVGSQPIKEQSAAYLSLYVNEENNKPVPYISFQDGNEENSCYGSVVRYKNNKWEFVGERSFTTEIVYDTQVAVNNNGIIYYTDRTSLWKYEDNWQQVGRFNGVRTSMLVDDDIVYVAFEDNEQNNKATVMKYQNGVFEALGKAGFSETAIDFPSIFMYQHVPYIAFKEFGEYEQGKATVMRFVNGNWKTVGTRGFSPDIVNHVSLAIDNNKVYVAFKDGSQRDASYTEGSGKASVMWMKLS